MKAVIQRVSQAQVVVNNELSGSIQQGLMVLVGVGPDDDETHAKLLADKICGLRIFADAADLMNLSLKDVGGALLAVSQFTLFADCRRGRRPFFGGALKGERASQLFNAFVDAVQAQGVSCETGVFGAMMQVSLTNDGPVTIVLDSHEIYSPRRAGE